MVNIEIIFRTKVINLYLWAIVIYWFERPGERFWKKKYGLKILRRNDCNG